MAKPYLTQLTSIISNLSLDSKLELKHFFSGAVAYSNGKIMIMYGTVGFAPKPPKGLRTKPIEDGRGETFRNFPKGPIKKEYVLISKDLINNQEEMTQLINTSIRFVNN